MNEKTWSWIAVGLVSLAVMDSIETGQCKHCSTALSFLRVLRTELCPQCEQAFEASVAGGLVRKGVMGLEKRSWLLPALGPFDCSAIQELVRKMRTFEQIVMPPSLVPKLHLVEMQEMVRRMIAPLPNAGMEQVRQMHEEHRRMHEATRLALESVSRLRVPPLVLPVLPEFVPASELMWPALHRRAGSRTRHGLIGFERPSIDPEEPRRRGRMGF